MDKPATPAAPAATPEPSLADLAKIIRMPTAPAAAPKNGSQKPRAQVAAAADPDRDPEHDGTPDDQDLELTAGEDPAGEQLEGEPAEGEQPAGALPEGEPPDGEPAEGEQPEETPAPEGLDEEDLAIRGKFTPEQQRRFDKAVLKKQAKIQDLTTQLESTQAELAEARATPPAPATPTAENPLADIQSEGDLDKHLASQRNLRRWALTHPRGGTVKDGDKDVEISEERVAQILAETEEILQDHGPKRREFIRTNQALEQAAVQDYPWLKSKNNQGSVAVEAMLRQYGNTPLNQIPGIRGSLADLFIGQVIRAQQKQQKLKASAPGAAGAKLPPKAPATPAGHRPPPRVAASTKQAAGALKTLETTGADPGNAALGALIGRRTK